MAIARVLFLALFAASVVLFVLYAVTSDRKYRDWGLRLLTLTVGLGVAFFVILAALRLAGLA